MTSSIQCDSSDLRVLMSVEGKNPQPAAEVGTLLLGATLTKISSLCASAPTDCALGPLREDNFTPVLGL